MHFDWLHCLTLSPDFFRIQPFLLLRTSLTSFQLGKTPGMVTVPALCWECTRPSGSCCPAHTSANHLLIHPSGNAGNSSVRGPGPRPARAGLSLTPLPGPQPGLPPASRTFCVHKQPLSAETEERIQTPRVPQQSRAGVGGSGGPVLDSISPGEFTAWWLPAALNTCWL